MVLFLYKHILYGWHGDGHISSLDGRYLGALHILRLADLLEGTDVGPGPGRGKGLVQGIYTLGDTIIKAAICGSKSAIDLSYYSLMILRLQAKSAFQIGFTAFSAPATPALLFQAQLWIWLSGKQSDEVKHIDRIQFSESLLAATQRLD